MCRRPLLVTSSPLLLQAEIQDQETELEQRRVSRLVIAGFNLKMVKISNVM